MRPAPRLEADLAMAVEDLVGRIERPVRRVLDEMAGRYVLAAGTLEVPWDGVFPSVVSAATAEHRARARAIEDPVDRWERAWNPTNWDLPAYDVDDEERDGDGDILGALERLDFAWPPHWVLQEVCRRVSHRPPPNVLPEFVCVTEDESLQKGLMEDIAYVAPPRSAEILKAQGLYAADLRNPFQ